MEQVAFDFISNVGFPIAVSVALFYQMNKSDETYVKVLREFQDVITNNTKSVEMLNSTVERLKGDMNRREDGEN